MSQIAPSEAATVRFGSVCDEIYRYPSYYDITYESKGVPEIRGELISERGKLDVERAKIRFISIHTNERFPKTQLDEGDLVMTVRGTIGKVAIVPSELAGANITANLLRISPTRSKVFPPYLWRVMRTPHFRARLDQVSPSTTIKTIRVPDLREVPVPLPPLPEQKRIAAILDKADAIRRKRQQAIQLTEQFLRSTFLDMFGTAQELLAKRPNNQANQDGWVRCKLGDQITLQRGIDITKKEHRSGQVPVISSGGISGYHDVAISEGPGVILGRKGSVGSVHFASAAYWPHDTTLWTKDLHGNQAPYIYYFFREFPISRYEASTANPSLNRNNLHPILVWWPPVSSQKRFSAIYEKISSDFAPRNRHIDEVGDNLFNSLVQRAFRGEL